MTTRGRCVNIHTIAEATETAFKRVNLKLGRTNGAKQGERRSKGCFCASNRYLHMFLYVYFTRMKGMREFFKYWQHEYEVADDYGKVLITIIVLHMMLLCAILISLPVGLYFISKNTTKEKEEWLAYKVQNACVAIAQSAPKEVRRLSGKIYVTRLEAGDVTWQCRDGNKVVRTWEQSQ